MKTIIACCFVALVVGGTTATAASLIGSKQIRDGTIKGRDIKKSTIGLNRLSPGVRKLLKNKNVGQQGGQNGATGATGAAGSNGNGGANGTNGTNGTNGQDAVATVSALTPDLTGDGVAPPAWGARSTSCDVGPGGPVSLAGGHLQLGPYVDGNQSSAADFNGYNDLTLKDLAYISYVAKYTQASDQHGGTPYFRIFTESFGHSVIFSPNTQVGGPPINSGEWRKWVVTSGSVLWDDDAGNDPDITWNALIAAHGDETISQIRVQAGCAGAISDGETALADDVRIEAAGTPTVYDFGS